MWLDNEVFRSVVAATPLISIDLVVCNADGALLLGLRNNRPAQGCWFVPGGRILKNESLDQAFLRLTREELGLAIERKAASLLGVYEHFYPDSVFAEQGAGPSTHYVVLAYQLKLPANQTLTPPCGQHASYRWWPPSEMQQSDSVHANSKAYLAALG
jgi:colanic acid biosynthesis protein WcaH